ncbi:hypothetical protein PHLCEN_2v2529 [Hermanssonia centrifuga]|uniref:Uncharacterized protein n=1 Tax=Hermanssonia centrifuga TaxID=98765 RepID=A0A2R6RLK5_9APHY|nr:hypothetical protein PHLCEN_2v8513 [Hermanssonia centrifuga]PSS30904.1 hypothetical protein PHLCEN_2v2529 [Hermanssonia centrifuga]
MSLPEYIHESDEEGSAESPAFIPKEWIGNGKQWVDTMPQCVVRARNEARRIPLGVLANIVPQQGTPIAAVLRCYTPPTKR